MLGERNPLGLPSITLYAIHQLGRGFHRSHSLLTRPPHHPTFMYMYIYISSSLFLHCVWKKNINIYISYNHDRVENPWNIYICIEDRMRNKNKKIWKIDREGIYIKSKGRKVFSNFSNLLQYIWIYLFFLSISQRLWVIYHINEHVYTYICSKLWNIYITHKV